MHLKHRLHRSPYQIEVCERFKERLRWVVGPDGVARPQAGHEARWVIVSKAKPEHDDTDIHVRTLAEARRLIDESIAS